MRKLRFLHISVCRFKSCHPLVYLRSLLENTNIFCYDPVKGSDQKKDKRMEKIKQHYDIYLNDLKFKVIACKVGREKGTLSVKTKVMGQSFPSGGQFLLSIPSSDFSETICISFNSMTSDTKIEHWEYVIKEAPYERFERILYLQ